MSKRAGQYVNNLSGELAYKSYSPAPLPPMPPISISAELLKLLTEAHAELGALNAITGSLADRDIFIAAYIRKEALISAQIEGTQCTIEDILDPEADSAALDNKDLADVVNYVRAVRFAEKRVKEIPICGRLLRETHAILMEGIRGGSSDKHPGEWRRTQNWIGASGCSLKDARYVPPNPLAMADAISALEKYVNDDTGDDTIVKTALIHYQFETIHPFPDGNGRIGRLLILLCLLNFGLISAPILYVSYFLKKNQSEYYDRMTRVRQSGDYEQWIGFFAEALREAAVSTSESIRSITALREKNLALIPQTGRRRSTVREVFSMLEHRPITDIGFIAKNMDISYNTAASAVKKLVELGILRTANPNAERGRLFMYGDYLDILRDGT